MRTEHLRYLVESVERGSMNKAAKQLYITQPAISNAITSIEEEIGFPVVDRSTMQPTTKGMMIVDDARIILDIMDGWTRGLTHDPIARNIKGELFVGDTGEIGLSFFRDVVAEFNKQHPNIIVHTVNPGNSLKELNNGNYEISVLSINPRHLVPIRDYLEHFQWKMELLFRDSYRLVVSTDHPLAKCRMVCGEAIKGYNLGLQRGFPYKHKFESILSQCHWSYEDSWTILNAVIGGECAGIMSVGKDLLLDKFIESGLLCAIPFREELPLHHYLIYMQRVGLSEEGRALLEFVKRCYTDTK